MEWRVWDYTNRIFFYAVWEEVLNLYASPQFLLMSAFDAGSKDGRRLWVNDLMTNAGGDYRLLADEGRALTPDGRLEEFSPVDWQTGPNLLALSRMELERLGIPPAWQIEEPLVDVAP